MHEEALLRRLRQKIDELSSAHGSAPIVAASVTVGPLSHLDEPRFRALWQRAMAGSAAEAARLDVETPTSLLGPGADAVLLRSVTFADPAERPRPAPTGATAAPPSEG